MFWSLFRLSFRNYSNRERGTGGWGGRTAVSWVARGLYFDGVSREFCLFSCTVMAAVQTREPAGVKAVFPMGRAGFPRTRPCHRLPRHGRAGSWPTLVSCCYLCVCVCERERDCELLCSNISVRILMMLCCVYAVCVSVWERQTCVCVCVWERERDCELLCCDISVHILMMLCCVWVTLSVCLCICVRETDRDKETGKMIYLNLQWSILSSFMCLHVWFIHTLILDGMFCTSLSGLKEGIAHHPQVRRRAFHTCLTVTVILDRMLHTSPSGRKGSFALLCHSHTWWIVLHIILRYKEGLFCTSFSDIKRALPITLIYERGFCTSPSDMKGGISHHPQTWEFCTWKGGLHITLRHGRGHAHHPQTLKGGLHITLGHERGHAHHSQTWKEELHITLGYEGGVLHVTLRHESCCFAYHAGTWRGVLHVAFRHTQTWKGGFAQHVTLVLGQEWFAHSHHP